MTVYFNKARDRWMYDFTRNGVRHNAYCFDSEGNPVTSRRAALEAQGVAVRAAEMAPKVPQAADMTIAQIVALLKPAWKGKADWPNKSRYIREILAYFGPDTPVTALQDEAKLDDYRTWAAQQPIMTWTGGNRRRRDDPASARFWKDSGRKRGPGTVNRYLPIIRAILERAHKMRDERTGRRLIEDLPSLGDLAEPKRKARPIPDEVLTHIMSSGPRHVVEALTATLWFGFRRGEIFERTIHDVDFEIGGVWLGADHVKDNEDAFMPGGPEAMAFLRTLVDQAKARGTIYLITWRRTLKDPAAQEKLPWMPIESPKSAWRTIMDDVEKRYGRRYRWHDIRAAFISTVAVQSGGPVAQALARHSDYRTTQAYIHIADDVQRAAAERLAHRPALKVVK